MRTTIDFPPDLHALARELAHQQNKTMSQVIVECVRKALDIAPSRASQIDTTTSGWPIVRLGHPVTAEDVRSLEDEW
ncbi:MAG: hypothetical protein OXC06_11030 [Acidimicrobiaceae bacterium]|nr:hypothetical protein [Acidimicrobiaceae bacterium]